MFWCYTYFQKFLLYINDNSIIKKNKIAIKHSIIPKLWRVVFWVYHSREGLFGWILQIGSNTTTMFARFVWSINKTVYKRRITSRQFYNRTTLVIFKFRCSLIFFSDLGKYYYHYLTGNRINFLNALYIFLIATVIIMNFFK